jgi:acyl dehydratase
MTVSPSVVATGDQLPELRLEMTATRIVAGAIATRDFMPVHHDRDFANEQGAPDIFMNIISTTAYCSRFLTDWAGPSAMLRRIAIRLGVPVHPRSTLAFSGTVTDVSRSQTGETLVDVDFRATTGVGDHVAGTATLALLGE